MPSIDGPQVLEANQRKWAEWIIQTAQKLVPNVRIEIIWNHKEHRSKWVNHWDLEIHDLAFHF